VEPYSGNHALPKVNNLFLQVVLFPFFDCYIVSLYPYIYLLFFRHNHQPLSSLPPLPEGGEVDERTIITDESQESSPPEAEVAGSHKSAASSEKDTETEASESARSLPSTVSPKNKRKRDKVQDSGTSKPSGSPAEKTSPKEEGAFCPYEDAIISS
jgi:hypothetical protein